MSDLMDYASFLAIGAGQSNFVGATTQVLPDNAHLFCGDRAGAWYGPLQAGDNDTWQAGQSCTEDVGALSMMIGAAKGGTGLINTAAFRAADTDCGRWDPVAGHLLSPGHGILASDAGDLYRNLLDLVDARRLGRFKRRPPLQCCIWCQGEKDEAIGANLISAGSLTAAELKALHKAALIELAEYIFGDFGVHTWVVMTSRELALSATPRASLQAIWDAQDEAIAESDYLHLGSDPSAYDLMDSHGYPGNVHVWDQVQVGRDLKAALKATGVL